MTPSPVMATMLPFSFSARTIRTLWSGETREKTAAVSARSLRAASSQPVQLRPADALGPVLCDPQPPGNGQGCVPVVPCDHHRPHMGSLNMATAWAASGRGGSAMAARPRKTMSSSFLPSPSLLAAPSTRSPWLESHEIRSWSLCSAAASQRPFTASRQIPAAPFQDHIRGSLRIGNNSCLCPVYGGHPLPLRIKGPLCRPGELPLQLSLCPWPLLLCIFQKGQLPGITDPSLFIKLCVIAQDKGP